MKRTMVLSQLRALAPANLRLQTASVRLKEVRANSSSRSHRFQALATLIIIVEAVIIDQATTSVRSRRSKALVAMGSLTAKAHSLHPPLSHNNIPTQTLILILNQPINNLTSHKASVKTLISSVETSRISLRDQMCNRYRHLLKWQEASKTIQPWTQWWTIYYNTCRKLTKTSRNR